MSEQGMDTGKTNYMFTEGPDYFIVEAANRGRVRVTLHSTHFRAEGEGVSTMFGLCELNNLTDWIADVMLEGWTPKPPKPGQDEWPGAKEWAKKQTAKALTRRVQAQRIRLLQKADKTILAVQRAIFAATFGDARLAYSEALYREKYIVSDIINYRAAAIAAARIQDLGESYARDRVAQSPEAAALLALAQQWGVNVTLNPMGEGRWLLGGEAPEVGATRNLSIGRCLTLMSEWRNLFSPTGQSYRSLDRTLMNLPGGVHANLVCELQRVHLSRPLMERLPLMACMLFTRHHRKPQPNGHVFQHATRAQVLAAMDKVGSHLRRKLSPRRTNDVDTMVEYLADYPEQHNGNLSGLADKSIRWHRFQLERNREATLAKFGGDRPVARPPVPPLEVAGVRFLATVGEVVDEGARMAHCVSSYAEEALCGWAFLFHIEHNGELATVMLNHAGGVVQAKGPRNEDNKAAAWGKRVLNRWGKQFPAWPEPDELFPDDEDFGPDEVPAPEGFFEPEPVYIPFAPQPRGRQLQLVPPPPPDWYAA